MVGLSEHKEWQIFDEARYRVIELGISQYAPDVQGETGHSVFLCGLLYVR